MMDSEPKKNLFLVFSIVVIDLIGFGIVVPILPFYAQQYGASATYLGFLLTSYAAMQFLFSPLWGKLSDRIGRKPTLLITMAGSAAGLVLLGFANSLFLVFVGRILGGIFAANISVASAYVSDITTQENRAKGMGLIGAAFGIGFLLGPAIGGFLSPYGYQFPLLTAAVLAGLNFLYALFRLQEPTRRHQTEIIQKRVLAHAPIRYLCLIYFVFTVSVTQLESVFAFFMMDRFAYDALHVGYLLTLMALVMVILQGGLMHWLARKYGEKKLLLAGAGLLALSLWMIPFSATPILLLFPLSLAAIGRGLGQPSLMTLVSHRSPASLQGSVMGVLQASASLGRVVGPFIAGFLYDHWHASPFYLASALMVVVLMMATKL